jgi:hypothetical protein
VAKETHQPLTERPKLSDGGHGAHELQPRWPAAVRWSVWLGGVISNSAWQNPLKCFGKYRVCPVVLAGV